MEAGRLRTDPQHGGSSLGGAAEAAGEAGDDHGDDCFLDDHAADLGQQAPGALAGVIDGGGVVVARRGQLGQLLRRRDDQTAELGDRGQGEGDLPRPLPLEQGTDDVEVRREVEDGGRGTPPDGGSIAQPVDVGAGPDETLDLIEDPVLDVAELGGGSSAQARVRRERSDAGEGVLVEPATGVDVRRQST